MVRLRFQREGKPKQPYYRLVAIDRRSARDGKPIEVIGSYNPRLETNKLTIKEERLKYWVGNGAAPSDTVRTLLIRAGFWKKAS